MAKSLLMQDISLYDKDIQTIIVCIQKYMNDSNFCVERLAKVVGMSRSVMFRKIKSSFGMSPILLIRSIRLEFGYQLLLKENALVSEVAFDCGFTSSQYFSICFKQKYGFSPGGLQKK